jgi:hypothetical protein
MATGETVILLPAGRPGNAIEIARAGDTWRRLVAIPLGVTGAFLAFAPAVLEAPYAGAVGPRPNAIFVPPNIGQPPSLLLGPGQSVWAVLAAGAGTGEISVELADPVDVGGDYWS